jgi:tetratricopeptide (TPR) repeat protein
VCPSPGPTNQSGGVNIGGTIGSVGGDVIGGNKGLDEETLVTVMERRGYLQAAETAGLQRRVIIAIARNLKRDVADFDQAVVELEHAVAVARDVIARGERGTNADEFVDKVLSEIADKTKHEDFDGAARAVDGGLADLERQEAEQRDVMRRRKVALLEAGVRQDILRRDAGSVARRIETLVAIDHPTERPAWLPEFENQYGTFYKEGDTKGINFSLSVAIELACRMVVTARDADERRVTLNRLGNALLKLGRRESGTARLKQAVEAYRAALEEMTRERVPLDWAETQENLGTALWNLGERESGTARLDEAVAAYRAALEEMTREQVPRDWARTQTNLGGALSTLGERESGTARLEEAVAACREALKEMTRERVPLEWAKTQAFLGGALSMLGKRESGTARLEEAVAACREALKERTRERVPLDWAATQTFLGGALRTLGERESGTARLEEAVNAYREALQERTREQVPLQWAMTQAFLGDTLRTLGERESGTARLEEAVAAWDACLTVTTSVWPSQWIQDMRARRDEAQSEIKRRSWK